MSAEGGNQVAAVVLAAGRSRRFGAANKLLAGYRGRPLIRHAAAAVAGSRAAPVLVVLGPDGDQIRAALEGLEVAFVENPRHEAGIATSIAAGLAALAGDAEAGIDGVVIVQGDMPALSVQLLDRLIEAFASTGGRAIVHPVDPAGVQGNPVLWPRCLWPRLMTLDGDKGAKGLIGAQGIEVVAVPWEGPEAFLDIDTADDLRKAELRQD